MYIYGYVCVQSTWVVVPFMFATFERYGRSIARLHALFWPNRSQLCPSSASPHCFRYYKKLVVKDLQRLGIPLDETAITMAHVRHPTTYVAIAPRVTHCDALRRCLETHAAPVVTPTLPTLLSLCPVSCQECCCPANTAHHPSLHIK